MLSSFLFKRVHSQLFFLFHESYSYFAIRKQFSDVSIFHYIIISYNHYKIKRKSSIDHWWLYDKISNNRLLIARYLQLCKCINIQLVQLNFCLLIQCHSVTSISPWTCKSSYHSKAVLAIFCNGYQKFSAGQWSFSNFPFALIRFGQLLTFKIVRNE